MCHKLIEKLGFLVVASLALAGCGKEAGRVPFSSEASKTATLQLAAGDVAFWTDLDIKYEGNAKLQYRIELLQGGANVASASCDPLGEMNVKVGWVETQWGSSRSRSGSGKMSCSANLAKGGPTDVAATLAFAVRPSKLDLKKADLVVKQ
jgi:hypothetical protein